MLDNIVEERKSLEVAAKKKIKRDDKYLAEQRVFKPEKLKLQAQNPAASVGYPNDGSWLTWGHTSLIDIACVIDILTGYVIDFEVMCKVFISKDAPLPVNNSPVEINSSSGPTNLIPSDVPFHVDETETNDLQFREEGQALNVEV
ncbi:hypothetical protein TNCV_4091951 [Trichonephila clavipes]|nr:hypothetical protein TNCV_4091951 [Trichonephila clavipes]